MISRGQFQLNFGCKTRLYGMKERLILRLKMVSVSYLLRTLGRERRKKRSDGCFLRKKKQNFLAEGKFLKERCVNK